MLGYPVKIELPPNPYCVFNHRFGTQSSDPLPVETELAEAEPEPTEEGKSNPSHALSSLAASFRKQLARHPIPILPSKDLFNTYEKPYTYHNIG